MKTFVVGEGTAHAKDLEALNELPDFRRATLNMKYAFLAASEALRALPSDVSRDQLALVVGTNFGELQSTCDFLLGLDVEKVARPLAFQNSLHHSTLGFLSRVLKITGPGLTVSRENFTADDALDAANAFLSEGAPFALVVTVDVAVAAVQGELATSGSTAFLVRNADV